MWLLTNWWPLFFFFLSVREENLDEVLNDKNARLLPRRCIGTAVIH